MATLPAAGYLSNAARTNAENKLAIEEVRDAIAESPGGSARTELTIASGAVVPPDGAGGGHHTIDTEGGAAADDLTNITTTNTPEGRILVLWAENAARVVTVKNANGGAGQVLTLDGADFVFSSLTQWTAIQRRGVDWAEVDRYVPADELATLTDATLAATDLIQVFDVSANTPKAMLVSEAIKAMAGLTPILRQAISCSPSVIDFVHGASGVVLDTTFASYMVQVESVRPATDDAYFLARVGTGAGPTYQTTTYQFGGNIFGAGASFDFGSTLDVITSGIAFIKPAATYGVGNNPAEYIRLALWLPPLNDASTRKHMHFTGAYSRTTNRITGLAGAGAYDASTALTGLRFMFSSGNFANAGSITLYGVRDQ